MNVLKRLKRDSEISFKLITHDIATSSELAARVAVMYAGQIVEIADARHFYPDPMHPYSKKLMASVYLRCARIRSSSSYRVSRPA
jgi:ABC-type dipeptide/oligopeptide/nickel transport system ATPase component